MKNEKKNEEFQSRRDFFKKAAKATLPIIGAIVLATAPTIVNAEKTPMGCGLGECSGSCSGGCMGCTGTCTGGCQSSCGGNCVGGCQGSCYNGCQGACRGTCQGVSYY